MAFVRIAKDELYNLKAYFINREGEMVMTCKGTMPTTTRPQRFYNGLYLYESQKMGCFANKNGEDITAESLGGTEISTEELNYKMLENGYFFVDKITNDYQGATYESAIYNTNLEQVQPYSTELYMFLYGGSYSNLDCDFSNGYLYKGNSPYYPTQTYHVETGIYEEYAEFPAILETSDLRYERSGSEKKLYKGSTEVADLSEYDTLYDVVCVGDIAVAYFKTVEGHEYFTVMDAEGKFQFDPIECGSIEFNGNVILTHSNSSNNKVIIKTFDLTGKELGCIEEVTGYMEPCVVSLGEDTIVVHNNHIDTLTYYDTNLNPLFPTE